MSEKKETVAFYSRYKGYARPVKEAYTQMIDGKLKTIPAKMVRFSAGFLRTDDPEIIEILSEDKHCVKVGEEEIQKIRQGKLQFKGNMTIQQVSEGDQAVQRRIKQVEKMNEKLTEENKQLKSQAGGSAEQNKALEEAEHELDRLDKENDQLRKEAKAGQEAEKKAEAVAAENEQLKKQIEDLKKMQEPPKDGQTPQGGPQGGPGPDNL